jgi:hypothetical protein
MREPLPVREASRVAVDRLVTYATLRELTPSRLSVDLRHVARLPDAREVLLLDDRGFTWSGPVGVDLTREQVEFDARTCVGPDEPVDPQTREHMEESHWAFIVDRLRAAGVTTSADEVRRLDHEVVFDERLRVAVT